MVGVSFFYCREYLASKTNTRTHLTFFFCLPFDFLSAHPGSLGRDQYLSVRQLPPPPPPTPLPPSPALFSQTAALSHTPRTA